MTIRFSNKGLSWRCLVVCAGASGQDSASARTARSMAGRMSSFGVDGEPVQEQSVAECHEGPRRRHGVGDTDGDHDPLSPPLELASLPPQRLAKLRVAGEFEEEA